MSNLIYRIIQSLIMFGITDIYSLILSVIFGFIYAKYNKPCYQMYFNMLITGIFLFFIGSFINNIYPMLGSNIVYLVLTYGQPFVISVAINHIIMMGPRQIFVKQW